MGRRLPGTRRPLLAGRRLIAKARFGLLQPCGAVSGQGFAAPPQGHAVLQADLTALQASDDVDEFVAGLLIGQIGDIGELGLVGGHGHRL